MEIISIIATTMSIIASVIAIKSANKAVNIKNEIIKLQAIGNTFINSPGAIQFTETNK